MCVNRRCNLRRQKYDQKIGREDSYNINTAHVECRNKGDTSNKRGDLDYFRVIQKIREQHTGKT